MFKIGIKCFIMWWRKTVRYWQTRSFSRRFQGHRM